MLIEFSKKQAEYINNATARWNIKTGATRSGKTFLDVNYTIPARIRERANKEGLSVIMGVTRETIERNVLSPMRDIYTDTLVGEIDNRNKCRMFGEEVYCLGAEKASQVKKIRGASFKYVYGDEVADWNKEVFELLKSRLDRSYSCFDGTLNPGNPNHWVKEFIDSDVNKYIQKYTIDDNPFNDPQFVTDLKKEYLGTVYYDRYILGEWALAEGLVYPMFKRDIHVVPTIDRDYSEYYLVNDYGTKHTCVFHLYGFYQGSWYQVKEYNHNGEKEGQKTVEEYYIDLLEFAKGYSIKMMYLDNAPIASSFNIYLSRQRDFKHKLADNDVLAGIQDVSSAFNKNILFINDCCTNTIAELGTYLWDQNSAEDKPVKENDDNVDAQRYFVRSKRINRETKKSKISIAYV